MGALINVTQTPNPGYIWLLMWMPGLSALLTCHILRRPLSSLGWSWDWRWVLIGYLIPVAYCLVASLVIWIVGIGGFPNSDFVHQAARLLGLGGAPDWVSIAMSVVLQGTTGMISGVGAALGEEIGWRGFLVPDRPSRGWRATSEQSNLSLRSKLRRTFAHNFRFGSTTEACG